MKNLLVAIATLATISLFSTASFAQTPATTTPATSGGALKTDSGTISIGLFVDNNHLNLGGFGRRFLSSFIPSFGYFVIPNLEATVGFLYGNDSTDKDGGGTDTDSMFGITIGANYYIPFRGTLSLVLGGALDYFSTTNEQEAGGITVKTEDSSFGVNLKAGLTYGFTPNIALEGGIKLFYISTDHDNNDSEGYFGLQLGYFGIKGYF